MVGGVLVLDAFSLMPMFIVRAMCTMTSLLLGFFPVHIDGCVCIIILYAPHIKIRYAPQKCDGDSPSRVMNWIRSNLRTTYAHLCR